MDDPDPDATAPRRSKRAVPTQNKIGTESQKQPSTEKRKKARTSNLSQATGSATDVVPLTGIASDFNQNYEQNIMESLRNDDLQKARHLIVLAMSRMRDMVDSWSGLIGFMEDPANKNLLMKFLAAFYPERISERPPNYQEALQMFSDCFVYEAFKTMGDATQHKLVKAASARYAKVQQLATKNGKLFSAAIDLLKSIRNECNNFHCHAHPIKQLHLSNRQICMRLQTDGILVPDQWSSDTNDEQVLHHFKSIKAIFPVYQLNLHGTKKQKHFQVHQTDPQYRRILFLELDKKLVSLREAQKKSSVENPNKHRITHTTGAYAGRQPHTMKNMFDVKLTAQHVAACMSTADGVYWEQQAGTLIDRPGLSMWDYHLLLTSKSDLEEEQEDLELSLLADDDDSVNSSSKSTRTGIRKLQTKSKQGQKRNLKPLNQQSIFEIFPNRDHIGRSGFHRYLTLDPRMEMLKTSAAPLADINVIAGHLALLAITHFVNKMGVPFDVLFPIGAMCREMMGICRLPPVPNKGRTQLTVHHLIKPEDKEKLKKKLDSEGAKYFVGTFIILEMNYTQSNDMRHADLVLLNRSWWSRDKSGATESVVRAYVWNMTDPVDPNSFDHNLEIQGPDGKNIPVDKRLPRFTLGDRAGTLAQNAEPHDVARILMTRYFEDLVAMVSNEYKRLIVFGKKDSHMGRWVELLEHSYDYDALHKISLDPNKVELLKSEVTGHPAFANELKPRSNIATMFKDRTESEQSALNKLQVTLWSKHAFVTESKHGLNDELEPELAAVYKSINDKCRVVSSMEPKYIPKPKSSVNGGIDKALMAVYGPHSDGCTTMNTDYINRGTHLYEPNSEGSVPSFLPTAHKMSVFTFTRGWDNSKIATSVQHGEFSGDTRKPYTEVITEEDCSHYQQGGLQTCCKHCSNKVDKGKSARQDAGSKKLILNPGLPFCFLEINFPEYTTGVIEIHGDYRVVSSMRTVARGGLDLGLYVLGLQNSPKKLGALSAAHNYNQWNNTNVLVSRREVRRHSVLDWHDYLSDETRRSITQKFFGFKAKRDRLAVAETEFEFNDHGAFLPPDKMQWPKEENLPLSMWEELHRIEVDVQKLFPSAGLPVELYPEGRMVRGICLPVQTMRLNKQPYEIAMCRSTVELCVENSVNLRIVKDGTPFSHEPILMDMTRNLPLPLGVIVERDHMGSLQTSIRSSDIFDLETRAALLLSQIYKQTFPDVTDCRMVGCFLMNKYYRNRESHFTWPYREYGYPNILPTGSSTTVSVGDIRQKLLQCKEEVEEAMKVPSDVNTRPHIDFQSLPSGISESIVDDDQSHEEWLRGILATAGNRSDTDRSIIRNSLGKRATIRRELAELHLTENDFITSLPLHWDIFKNRTHSKISGLDPVEFCMAMLVLRQCDDVKFEAV
ncbi:expressed unknown protein [Seminavis robusta]|uniref:Uncharacterized protein n=1 Tax=Seminavis robusta TaxID=568900 RepID=A0A9N8ELF3_9STRA|nr:expressed unknown protein [Seminavis robusta]|eukprot:Sro1410_g270330.1 n/a (1404) ;mRNA; f:22571-26782